MSRWRTLASIDWSASHRPQLFGQRHRPVMAAGAADADGQVGLAFGGEAGNEELRAVFDPRRNSWASSESEHVIGDRLVGAPVGAQLGHPVRVGEEAHVEHEVGVAGGAVLEPEGGDRHPHRPLGGAFGELVFDPVPQLVDVEVGGVDDRVGLVPQRVQQFPFGGDRLGQAAFASGWGRRFSS
jgi:hypothetical protein